MRRGGAMWPTMASVVFSLPIAGCDSDAHTGTDGENYLRHLDGDTVSALLDYEDSRL